MGSYTKIVICQSIFLIMLCYYYASYAIILPFMLENQKNEYNLLTFIYSGELLAIFFLWFSIDNPSLGRKRVILICTCLIGVLCLAVYRLESIFFIYFMFILKLLNKILSSVSFCYMNELFPTHIRSKSVGLILFFGRISAFFSSFVVFTLYYWDIYWPFVSYAVSCLIAILTLLVINKDTTERGLDVKVKPSIRIPVRRVCCCPMNKKRILRKMTSCDFYYSSKFISFIVLIIYSYMKAIIHFLKK